MTVVPICAHTLQRYSMVLNDTDIVKITVPERENTLQLSLDGTMSFDFLHSDILRVRGISKPIRFVRFEGQEFFSSITKNSYGKCAIENLSLKFVFEMKKSLTFMKTKGIIVKSLY